MDTVCLIPWECLARCRMSRCLSCVVDGGIERKRKLEKSRNLPGYIHVLERGCERRFENVDKGIVAWENRIVPLRRFATGVFFFVLVPREARS